MSLFISFSSLAALLMPLGGVALFMSRLPQRRQLFTAANAVAPLSPLPIPRGSFERPPRLACDRMVAVSKG